MKRRKLKNLRDMGGITLSDGSTIRSGLLLRSEAPVFDTDGQLDGIRCVIDLRTPLEVSEKPDILPEGVEYVHIPVFEDKVIGISKETGSDHGAYIRRIWKRSKIRAALPDMHAIYSSVMLDDGIVSRIGQALRVIMDNSIAGRPTLIHCSQGKDRTGAVSALLLSILEADRDMVITDYVRGGNAYRGKALKDAILVSTVKYSPDVALKVYNASVARKSFIEATLRSIDARYGSMKDLIHNVFGFSDGYIAAFRESCTIR